MHTSHPTYAGGEGPPTVTLDEALSEKYPPRILSAINHVYAHDIIEPKRRMFKVCLRLGNSLLIICIHVRASLNT
jgi:hypothetical protein